MQSIFILNYWPEQIRMNSLEHTRIKISESVGRCQKLTYYDKFNVSYDLP